MLHFIQLNKFLCKEKALAFNQDRCCHLALCLRLILFHCLNINIYFYLETSAVKSSNLYLIDVHFLTPMLIRHLWQLKTFVFLHWCLICAVLLAQKAKVFYIALSWKGLPGMALSFWANRTAHIRHQCMKTTVLSCHRWVVNTGVEKINNI